MIISKADKWFSVFIRVRDAQVGEFGRCCTCGDYINIRHHDCGHYVGRQHHNTRFDEHNAHLQCKKCNQWEEGRKESYAEFIICKYGEDELMRLRIAGAMTKKTGKYELEIIANLYREKAQKLAKEKGITIWI